MREINLVLNRYREKLYVFVAPVDSNDLFVRERIAIGLVRVAQSGNVLAKLQLVKLVRYTVDMWLETYRHMSRWKGRNDEIRKQLEGCIRNDAFKIILITKEYLVDGGTHDAPPR